jgi:hypothetical protein
MGIREKSILGCRIFKLQDPVVKECIWHIRNSKKVSVSEVM